MTTTNPLALPPRPEAPAARTLTVTVHHACPRSEPRSYSELTIAEAIATARSELKGLREHLTSGDRETDAMWRVTRDSYLTSIAIRLVVAADKLDSALARLGVVQ
jgi:hypothetical protein